jgi:hypothetical protein
MAENIMNKLGLFGSNVPGLLDKGLANLYNRDQLVDLENTYGNAYQIGNSASGPLSDARHMAAMNNLSNKISNSGLGIAMGLPSEFAGDVAAFGAGLINEIPALTRGFNKQNLGEIVEDIKANYAGSFGTPNSTTAEDIYSQVFTGTVPERFASGTPIGYGAAQAADLPINSLERDFPGMSGSDIIEMMNNRGPVSTNIEDAPQIKEAIYQDRIMNPNLPAFASQPQYRIRDQLKRDFLEGGLFKDAKQSLGQTKDAFLEDVGGVKNIIGSGAKKGFDLAKQIPNMLFSAATGIPFAGQIAQGIGGLLSNIFQESPEQKNFRENIATDPEYQNLVNSIAGMSNYNQIFGMGSGRGLMGAIDKRLATINRTRKRNDGILSDTLKRREEKLKALREIERQKESAFLESQRRGRRPGTGGDGGGGTQDSGGPTGGYSYDSGGRQGFGYGLKDGGLASMFTRRG